MAFQRRKTEPVGVKAPLPGFVEAALATSIGKVPSGDRWIHEIKFDGYRVQVHLANEAVRIFTWRGHDWTNRFKKVADDAWHIKAASAVVDGEIVVPAADGTIDFSVLQNELKGQSTKIALVAFDLLYLNGHDLRKLPLLRRKAELRKIIARTDIQFSESFEVDGPEMLAHACKVGLEGVVSKVRDSVYPSGRSNDWVKKTCAQRETLTIAGFALDGTKWDGLYVGRRKGGDLVYAGKVDHGFDKVSAADLKKRLTPLVRKTQAFSKRIAHKGIWVEPKLLAEIEYRRNPPRVRCDTRSSRAFAKIFEDRKVRPGISMQACVRRSRPYVESMQLTQIQNFAIQARVAAVIGATVFDRVFSGIRFAEIDGPLLYVYARDEASAGEIEDDFSLMIADVASRILRREVDLVIVLPKVLQ